MANKAKHAHGSRANLNAAIANKTVDAFDVLFLSGENENSAIGWVDKNGNPIILSPADEVSKLEVQVDEKLATKADAKEVETKLAEKANVAEVEAKIEQVTQDAIDGTKSYVDGKVEAAVNEHLAKMYEVANVPAGTLVDYSEKEIRIMCPANSVFTKQAVGTGGDANTYYMTFKTFAPNENAVGYIEHLNGQADEEILTTFSTDEYGRRYQPTWLGLATYDEATDTWSYYGAKSSKEKYIGWDYQIDWYDANGVMIASDSVRINLSNEQCHSSIEPYYVGKMMKEVDVKIEEKIAEMESAYEIIEF